MLPGPLTTAGGALLDARGRRVILRGANLSGRHKAPPFAASSAARVLDRWPALGWNVVRLVIPWESIEPERGHYDAAQLDHLAALARAAHDRGVHVIADFHQDIYARAFGGSGAPAWSIAPDDRPSEAPPPDRFWFLRYATSEGVRRSLARFWADEDGVQSAFLGAVDALAARLADEPAVIGLEPWNEPFPGDRDFAAFEGADLEPFLRRVISRARQRAPRWLAFVEGTVLASEQGTSLSMADVPGLVYCPHFYDKVVTTSQSYEGDTRELDKALATFTRDAARLGAPWLLGEYGVSRDTTRRVEYLAAHQSRLTAAGVGGTAWHFDPSGHDEWNDEQMALDDALLDVLAHPYAAALHGGSPRATLDGDFTLEWTSAGEDDVSELVIPERWSASAVESSAPYTHVERRLHVRAPAGPARITVRAPA